MKKAVVILISFFLTNTALAFDLCEEGIFTIFRENEEISVKQDRVLLPLEPKGLEWRSTKTTFESETPLVTFRLVRKYTRHSRAKDDSIAMDVYNFFYSKNKISSQAMDKIKDVLGDDNTVLKYLLPVTTVSGVSEALKTMNFDHRAIFSEQNDRYMSFYVIFNPSKDKDIISHLLGDLNGRLVDLKEQK